MGLVTDFVKVAQSGRTADGRKIDATQLKEIAANYDKSVYTAMVFPNHERNWSYAYGTVEAVEARAEGNDIIGLYAKVSPNGFWQSDIRYGQNVFTSIEITTNFAGTGEAYLTGLGATNSPASLGVEQLKFSHNGKLYTPALETVFTEEPAPKPSFFSKFKWHETEMKPDEAAAFQTQIDALTQKLSILESKPETPPPAEDQAKYAALTAEINALKAANAVLTANAAKREGDYASLKTDLETFSAQLTAALKEQPGTPSSEKPADNFYSYI